MTTAKTESEKLLNQVLPLAERMLAEQGEFLPYGGALRPSGQFTAVAGQHDGERVPAKAMIALLEGGLRQGAAAGDYRATALVYDVRVTPPGADQPSDAVAVELEHKDGYAVTVFYPYVVTNGRPLLAEPFATAHSRAIFAS